VQTATRPLAPDDD